MSPLGLKRMLQGFLQGSFEGTLFLGSDYRVPFSTLLKALQGSLKGSSKGSLKGSSKGSVGI